MLITHRRRVRALASTLTAALIASLAFVGAAAPASAEESAGPQLTVSKVEGLDPAGETVTVSGSGYDPAVPMYLILCRDVPLEQVDFGFAGPCTAGSKQITANPTTATQVKLESDGSFTTTFVVKDLGDGGTAVYTLANHLAQNNRTQDAKQTLAFAEPAPAGPQLTVSPSTGVDATKANTFEISGTGYVGPGAANGVYVLLGATSVWSGGRPLVPAGWLDQVHVAADKIVDGSFTTSLRVLANTFEEGVEYQVATSAAHALSATNRTMDAFAPISIGVGSGVDPTDPVEPGPVDPPEENPDTPDTPEVPETPVVSAGQLSWAFKDSWNGYLTSVAHGTVTTTNGVGQDSSGRYTFAQVDGGNFDDETGLGTVYYQGTVRFVSSQHGFDIALTDPRATVTADKVELSAATSTTATSGTGSLTRRVLATFDVPGSQPTNVDGLWSWSGLAGVFADTAGPDAWADYVGEAAAPLGFTYGSAVEHPVSAPNVTLAGAFANGSIAQGETARFEISGLESGTKVSAEVHSKPVSLGSQTAGASGTVVFSWNVPADFATGEHTFVLDVPGLDTVNQKFTVVAATVDETDGTEDSTVTDARDAADQCVARTVAGSTLTWGVRDSFVGYITGNIANGSISTSGATTVGNDVRWSGGSGSYNTDAAVGRVSYSGSVTFTGHDGVLNLTLSSPRLVISSASRATLVVDVRGTTMEGESFAHSAVGFASVNLASAGRSQSGSTITYTGAPATLTSAGAAAFAGFYNAGDALDPVSFTLPLGAETECSAATGTLPATGAGLSALGLAATLLVVGASSVVIARKRRLVTV